MGKVFVEQKKDGTYKATTESGQQVAKGSTQKLAIDRAQSAKPDATILVERVRDTKVGGRDKWRRP